MHKLFLLGLLLVTNIIIFGSKNGPLNDSELSEIEIFFDALDHSVSAFYRKLVSSNTARLVVCTKYLLTNQIDYFGHMRRIDTGIVFARFKPEQVVVDAMLREINIRYAH